MNVTCKTIPHLEKWNWSKGNFSDLPTPETVRCPVSRISVPGPLLFVFFDRVVMLRTVMHNVTYSVALSKLLMTTVSTWSTTPPWLDSASYSPGIQWQSWNTLYLLTLHGGRISTHLYSLDSLLFLQLRGKTALNYSHITLGNLKQVATFIA